MDYELGVRLDAITQRLEWIILAMSDNGVTPKQEEVKENDKKSKGKTTNG